MGISLPVCLVCNIKQSFGTIGTLKSGYMAMYVLQTKYNISV